MVSSTNEYLEPDQIGESKQAVSGTALVAQGAAHFDCEYPAYQGRPAAAFIAHLIAANENVPQLRTLRRNDPGAASAIYDKAVGQARKDTLIAHRRSLTSRTV